MIYVNSGKEKSWAIDFFYPLWHAYAQQNIKYILDKDGYL